MASTMVNEQQQQQQQPSLMIHDDGKQQRQQQQQKQQHRYKNFAHAKDQCLNHKPDKSSAGRIDAHAMEICSMINAREHFYTTSSCSGRCFLYTGLGIKSTDTFQRFRVTHELIPKDDDDAVQRYFNLETLHSDPTGGCGDDIFRPPVEPSAVEEALLASSSDNDNNDKKQQQDVWLRFEPFILHVACRSLAAALALMTAARPAFKNVGLTSWKQETTRAATTSATTSNKNNDNQHVEKYIVAIWGDEGLDMPLCMPNGCPLVPSAATTTADSSSSTNEESSSSSATALTSWLAQLVNERQNRNWSKIARFVQAVREMEIPVDDDDDDNLDPNDSSGPSRVVPRSFDVIGDVALIHKTKTTTTTSGNDDDDDEDNEQQRLKEIGQAIMKKNKAIKVVVLRQSNLVGPERAPGHDDNLILLAGGPQERLHPSLITTHSEHGISCVVNLHETFFSPRMCHERQRICNQVQKDENVLVLFAGVCMEALLLAGRTRAKSVVAMECNPAAITCARRSQRMLERNKTVLVPGAAQRLEIVQGDVLQLLPNSIPKKSFNRILAPRPKLGAQDGDLGCDVQKINNKDNSNNNASNQVSSSSSSAAAVAATSFLAALLPVLKDGGICHWYDFVADHEFPTCLRIQNMLQETCSVVNDNTSDDLPRCIKVLHVANAGSVAMRQLRVCIDFCIVPNNDKHREEVIL